MKQRKWRWFLFFRYPLLVREHHHWEHYKDNLLSPEIIFSRSRDTVCTYTGIRNNITSSLAQSLIINIHNKFVFEKKLSFLWRAHDGDRSLTTDHCKKLQERLTDKITCSMFIKSSASTFVVAFVRRRKRQRKAIVEPTICELSWTLPTKCQSFFTMSHNQFRYDLRLEIFMPLLSICWWRLALRTKWVTMHCMHCILRVCEFARAFFVQYN